MRKKYLEWSLWLIAAVSTLYHSSHAAGFQPLPTIQLAAEQQVLNSMKHVSGKLLAKAEDLDSRLRVALCPTPLEAFLPSGASIGSRVTVGVRCTPGTPWTIYLPVNIEIETAALVTNKSLARDAVISGLDVEVRTQRLPGTGTNTLQSIEELAGKRLKRDIPAGTLLTVAMLQPELLVHRGQQVTLVATVSGIEVHSQGVALSDGSVSSRIRVKNLNSAKVVEGTVDSSSTVRVDL